MTIVSAFCVYLLLFTQVTCSSSFKSKDYIKVCTNTHCFPVLKAQVVGDPIVVQIFVQNVSVKH